MNNIGMNDDMLVNNLLGELIGSNEDCLRKASEQIDAHVLHHINENTTEDYSYDTEMMELVKKYLTNKNNSSVPLPISKEEINDIVLSFRDNRINVSKEATQIAFLDMKARHDQAIHRITDLYSDKLESVIREESERLKNNPISEEGQRKLEEQAARHELELSKVNKEIEKLFQVKSERLKNYPMFEEELDLIVVEAENHTAEMSKIKVDVEKCIQTEVERSKINPSSEGGEQKFEKTATRRAEVMSKVIIRMEREHADVMNSLNDEFLGVQNQSKRALRICEEATELVASRRTAKKRC